MLTKALAEIVNGQADVYPVGAIGACACVPGTFGMMSPLAGSQVRSRCPPDHSFFIDKCVDACVADMLASETIDVPAGETVTVTLEPSKGCAFLAYAKIMTFDPATGEFLNMQIGRFRIGECAIDCRVNPVPSRIWVTEDCLGCPLPVMLGRADEDEAFNFTVTNNTLTPGQVVIVGWGRCLPGFTCLTGCPAPNGNGNGMTGAGNLAANPVGGV